MALRTSKVDRLLPFRQVSENDTINQYSLNGTGVMGTLVSIESANMDDQHGWNYDATPGASYEDYGIHSYRYETKAKVRPVQSGDTKYDFLGVTLFNVAEFDENDEKYLYYVQKAKENSTVVSGRSVPIGTRGVYTFHNEAYTNDTGNLPEIGDVIVPSNTEAGKFDAVELSEVDGTAYTDEQILGKVIGTGSKFGGYVMVKISD